VAGDEDFKAFYLASYARLVGQLHAITGDLAESEDIVQEAFVRAASRWKQLRLYEAPEAWVRRVALRLASNMLRRARRQVAAYARLDAMPTTPALEPADLTLLGALQQLPLKYREVLVLHHCLDMSVQEVAHQLGIPNGTVKTRLVKGRIRLAAALAMDRNVPEEPEEPRNERSRTQ
jgi:RNA polymerase sigma-70 factor (ECF subfamily)